VATRRLTNSEDMFIRFDKIHERDGRTDEHRTTACTGRAYA